MIIYHAMYKTLDDGVHAEVLDFPGAISAGRDLDEARRNLAGALVDMAETNLLAGDPLPKPDDRVTDDEADLIEPIHLVLTASHRVAVTTERSPA
ncbi:MAG: type II toxin-antitoxin system HicB family antitoxin [Planctomycetota bacterium]